jgi:hypothetical protein
VTAEEDSSVTGWDEAGCVDGCDDASVVEAADEGGSDVGATDCVVGLEADDGAVLSLALGGGFALEAGDTGEGTTRDDVLAVPLPDMAAAVKKRCRQEGRGFAALDAARAESVTALARCQRRVMCAMLVPGMRQVGPRARQPIRNRATGRRLNA